MRRAMELILVLMAVPFGIVAGIGFAILFMAGLVVNALLTASNRAQGR
jgi:hypothetical protein